MHLLERGHKGSLLAFFHRWIVELHDVNDLGASASAIISNNTATGSTYNGIALDSVSGAVVSHNTTNNNGSGNAGDAGIGIYSSFFSSTNNTIDNNKSSKNNGDGIFVDSGSMGNTLDHNELKDNSNFDAEDQDRTWQSFSGRQSNKLVTIGTVRH